jgi:hypothetical protein
MNLTVGRIAATATAAVVLAAGSALAVAHVNWGHAGEHFVDGHADRQDVTVKLYRQGRLGIGGTQTSRTCAYSPERGTVDVPVHLFVSAGGAVTIHVTANVLNLPDGADASQYDGGSVDAIASVTQDFAMSNGMGTYVHVPLDQAAWQDGANDCAISGWTVTDGAWFSNDD